MSTCWWSIWELTRKWLQPNFSEAYSPREKWSVGPLCITSWYPKFNGGHFGLPPSSIRRMTGLGGNFFCVNSDKFAQAPFAKWLPLLIIYNGACAHYVMVSKFQWKPFWLATQRDPQNDWTATQNRVNYDVFAQAPLLIVGASLGLEFVQATILMNVSHSCYWLVGKP